jgi:hypothetical protein
VQSELNIIANITDNQAIYRCEAQNSGSDVPLFDKKTLSVHCKYLIIIIIIIVVVETIAKPPNCCRRPLLYTTH